MVPMTDAELFDLAEGLRRGARGHWLDLCDGVLELLAFKRAMLSPRMPETAVAIGVAMSNMEKKPHKARKANKSNTGGFDKREYQRNLMRARRAKDKAEKAALEKRPNVQER